MKEHLKGILVLLHYQFFLFFNAQRIFTNDGKYVTFSEVLHLAIKIVNLLITPI